MSDPVRERLDSLRARLILSSAVVSFHYYQEETVGDVGYFRVRCTLIDGSERQLIERFRDVAIARICRYVAGLDRASFLVNEEKKDAVIRNIEIIGEAA